MTTVASYVPGLWEAYGHLARKMEIKVNEREEEEARWTFIFSYSNFN